jgi:hypothetical protein
MGLRGDFKDLVKIVTDGGLEVVTEMTATGPKGNTSTITTADEKKETREERKTYKIHDRAGIRTTIQLDADYVTIISREVLTMPELWERHTEILKEKLSVLERVRGLAWKHGAITFLSSTALILYAQYAQSGGYPEFQLNAGSVLGLIGAALSVIMLFLNRITWWLAKWYVRRRFSSLVAIPVKE